jgi:molecular chaperone DnaJ
MATATQRDYYEVLGVPRDADAKAIKEAFRALALKHHPDRNKEPGAEERFKEIAAAYAVLSDPAKRREYDTRGFAGVAGFTDEDLFRHIDFGDLLGGLGFDWGPGPGGGLFDRFFGRRPAGPPHGENIEVPLTVRLSRVASGGEERVTFTRPSQCDACLGTGAKDGTARKRCETCRGAGTQTKESRRRDKDHDVVVRQIKTSASCQGRGEIIEQPCPACEGRGTVDKTESLTVNVPVGVEDGVALRVPGHGMPSEAKGGVPGDLYVVIRSEPDARFTREGADLGRTEGLSVPEAVLGTRRRVPTLDGSVDVKIPAGTQPDAVLRLAKKGLPEFGTTRRGDLYLRLQVHIPRRLTKKQRELYTALQPLEATPGAASPESDVDELRERASTSSSQQRTDGHANP